MVDPIFCDDYSDPGGCVSDGFRLDALREAAAGIVGFIRGDSMDKPSYNGSGGDDRPVFPGGAADG